MENASEPVSAACLPSKPVWYSVNSSRDSRRKYHVRDFRWIRDASTDILDMYMFQNAWVCKYGMILDVWYYGSSKVLI